MDGYFVAPPQPITVHAPFAPVAVPLGNCYQVNQWVINSFWSVREQWFEERWNAQSEVTVASSIAQVQQPAFVPYGSMVPVVMLSW